MWTKETLKEIIQQKLGGYKFIVVSNREPYSHEYSGKKISCVPSVSGLTIALNPVMQACDGTWVAHGSGDADKTVVDKQNKIRVPPENPAYTLKRVWLTKQEENGYYYGYANQALWPMSHIVYHMPVFLPDHWEYYKKVNQKFAQAILEEIGDEKAFVWLQDYHLTLCAKYIKEKRPDVIVALFWHIPWPNPEAFRICPQKKEIMEGLLSNDLLGFHIPYHCHNFLSAAEIELESKVDWEESAITYKDHKTIIQSFPISIDADGIANMAGGDEVTKRTPLIAHEIDPPYEILAVSIDRVDYTKGILQKIQAVDRFLDKHPQYKEKFVFIQIGALSRMHIKAYKQLIDDVQALAEEVNWKHQSGAWYPIVITNKKLDYTTHLAYYRTADICIVGSLHDGMNLVAKEYLMADADNKGILILSRFAGAARELKEAILVNPYDPDGVADAIKQAIEMNPVEKTERLNKMKETIRENNIYFWAGNFIEKLVKL
ncbi:MAG: trehalose-6-phosphate synthase [Planctomycetes bacterium]|nr:trehalose-6-phosphate synthase [Planctomycetota bacterium]